MDRTKKAGRMAAVCGLLVALMVSAVCGRMAAEVQMADRGTAGSVPLAERQSAAGSSAAGGQGTGKSAAAGEQVAGRSAAGSQEAEPVEITVGMQNAEEAFLGDAVLWEVEDKLGIRLIPVDIEEENYSQVLHTLFLRDNLPDVFMGDFRNMPDYAKWIHQGLIREIPADLSAYPHLEQYLSGEAAQEAKMDGVLYCIPRQSYPSQEWTSIDRCICYRWDLAQKAGIREEPKTWEEFEEMMLRIIEADPEGTGVKGMIAANRMYLMGLILPYASSIAAGPGSGLKWVKAGDGTYLPAYFHEDMLPAFRLARDLYESGAIAKDIMMTMGDAANEKFLKGESAAIAVSGGFDNTYGSLGKHWNNYRDSPYLEDVRVLGLMPDKNGKKAYNVYGYAWSESYIRADVEGKKLEKILQLYDYLLTDEGTILSNYGPEGELYDIVDGKVLMREEGCDAKETYPSCEVLSMMVRWPLSEYDERFPANVPEEYRQVNIRRAREAKEVEIPEYYPECSQKMNEIGTEFAVHMDEDLFSIMTGKEPVKEMWEQILQDYAREGLWEMVEQVNQAMGGEQEKE